MHLLFTFQLITDDDVDRIAMCLRVLAEKLPMMHGIFTDSCRESLAAMLHAKAEEEKEYQKVGYHKYEVTSNDVDHHYMIFLPSFDRAK